MSFYEEVKRITSETNLLKITRRKILKAAKDGLTEINLGINFTYELSLSFKEEGFEISKLDRQWVISWK